ncbi:MAG: M15 family metallopeptidase, partial [Butyricicoccus sp.]
LLSGCKDGDDLSDWAREASAYFLLQGVIEPDDDNKLNPSQTATSEQLAVTAYRAASAGRNKSMQTSSKKLTAMSTHSGQDRVSWSNCDADSYRIYYYEKNGFEEEPVYIDLVMAGTNSTLESTIPECVQEKVGDWYWSVDAFDCDGKVIGSTESTTKLHVTKEVKNSVISRTGSASISRSEIQAAAKSGLAYAGESFESRCERIFGAGTTYYRRYSSEAEAAAHQTTIQIPVWRLKSNGQKYSDTVSLTVNSGIADTVKQIFQEIYESDEKFPIKDIGGYNWRGDNSSSQHCLGLAIDINYNENYMCSNNGTALTGSYWLPGSDPYSIAADSDVVRIFAKYGFGWGGTWSSKKDYMHFSYFGT